MSMPKHNLKEIKLTTLMVDDDDESYSKQIMDILAAGTEKVETIHLSDCNPPANTFDMFIDKNKSTLRSVSMIKISRNPISQSDLGKIVGKFLECPCLEDICFKEIPSIGVLRTLRQRGIHFRRSNSTSSSFTK